MSESDEWDEAFLESDDPIPLRDELIESIVARLSKSNARGEGAPSENEDPVHHLVERRGEAIYADIVWNLTNLRYSPDQAKEHWLEVLNHKERVRGALGRDFGLRVAALDYFVNILGELASPRVIDPDVLAGLYKEAMFDPLTGLGNRRLYKERLAAEINRAKRYRTPFVVAIFDVDDFKSVNDRLGHAGGDRVLQRIAKSFSRSIRKSDVAARWGGEEFVILMPETHKRGGSVLAERLRIEVESSLHSDRATVSGGIAAYPVDGENESALFSFADRALYRAKSEGKNRVCVSPLERRAFPRLDESLVVRITPLAQDQEPLEARTSNIGVGGIAFRHDQPLWITSHVKGEIDIRGQIAPFIGRVVYVEETGKREFEVGLQFTEIDSKPRDLILKYTG